MPRLMDLVADEPAAYEFMERMRWGAEPVCPHCHSTNVRYIAPLNGTSRATRTGAQSKRRVWKCRDCKKQFSALTGTVFHGTKIPVRTWVFVIFEMCSAKNGVSAREIERRYGVTNKTAWFMLHRIREAMGADHMKGMMGGDGGTIVADETFIGGRITNKHKSKVKPVPYGQPDPHAKTPVLSLVDTRTGEVRSRVVRDVTAATLGKVMAEHVDMAGSVLHTDESASYKPLSRQFAAHETVNHFEGEYVAPSGATTNHVEGFFSQLKRSLDGTHHRISRKHLHRYLGEFDYRYTTRKMSDTDRFANLLLQVAGVRLTYRPLIGG